MEQEIERHKLICFVCGFEWFSQKLPKQCPNCRNYQWNIPLKYRKGKGKPKHTKTYVISQQDKFYFYCDKRWVEASWFQLVTIEGFEDCDFALIYERSPYGQHKGKYKVTEGHTGYLIEDGSCIEDAIKATTKCLRNIGRECFNEILANAIKNHPLLSSPRYKEME